MIAKECRFLNIEFSDNEAGVFVGLIKKLDQKAKAAGFATNDLDPEEKDLIKRLSAQLQVGKEDKNQKDEKAN